MFLLIVSVQLIDRLTDSIFIIFRVTCQCSARLLVSQRFIAEIHLHNLSFPPRLRLSLRTIAFDLFIEHIARR